VLILLSSLRNSNKRYILSKPFTSKFERKEVYNLKVLVVIIISKYIIVKKYIGLNLEVAFN